MIRLQQLKLKELIFCTKPEMWFGARDIFEDSDCQRFGYEMIQKGASFGTYHRSTTKMRGRKRKVTDVQLDEADQDEDLELEGNYYT
jgi:hypothetical protein